MNEHGMPVRREQWLEQVEKDLKGADFREKLIHTRQGIDIQPLYLRDDLPAFTVDPTAEFMADLEPEFEEAILADGAVPLTWSMVEDWQADASTLIPELVYALRDRGITDLHLRVQQVDLWDSIFDQIRKTPAGVNYMLDATGPIADGAASIWRERIGFLGERDRLIHSIEFDPISFWERNGYPQSTGADFTRLAELVQRIGGHLQDCRLIKVDTTDLSDAGADVVDQLAQCLQRTYVYCTELEERGVPLYELLQLFTFRFGVDTNYFFEIAKLRAFKVLWNNFVKMLDEETEYIPNPYMHAVVSTRSFTTEDAHSNLLRGTTAGMSALLGGVDALTIAPFINDSAQAEQAVRLSTNIQHLLRYESKMDAYRNAANGSYYIEQLTYTIGKQAWEKFLDM